MKTAFGILLLGLAPIAADTISPPRVAVLSTQRLANESAEGKTANQRLSAIRDKLAADLATKQKELQQDSARPADQRQAELQRLAQQSQNDFNNAQRQLQNEMRVKIEPILTQITSEQGLDIVLNADNAVAWVSKKFDITDQVLAKLNAAPKPQ